MNQSRISIFVAGLLLYILASPYGVAQTERAPTRDGNRSFSRQVVTWSELKYQNVVMQKRDYSCGAASLATILRYYWGKDIQEIDVLEALERSLKPQALKDRVENGLTMADLKVVSDRMGFDAAVGKLSGVEKLAESKIPVIVTIQVEPDLSHFSGIVPCGIRDHGVTSLVDLGLPVTMADLDAALFREFGRVFGP